MIFRVLGVPSKQNLDANYNFEKMSRTVIYSCEGSETQTTLLTGPQFGTFRYGWNRGCEQDLGGNPYMYNSS
jgi:hypothetical protein